MSKIMQVVFSDAVPDDHIQAIYDSVVDMFDTKQGGMTIMAWAEGDADSELMLGRVVN